MARSEPPPRRRVPRRPLSAEERALWAEIQKRVKPLPGRKPLPEPSPVAAAEPDRVEPAAPTGPSAPPPRPRPPTPPPLAPLERRHRREVARGQRGIDRKLDLHGHNQAEAHQALLAFLVRAQAQGDRLVIVVTGKGGDAKGGDHPTGRGVLRRLVPLWLAEPGLRRIVLGFETAGPSHGGEGALYVRLRKAGPDRA